MSQSRKARSRRWVAVLIVALVVVAVGFGIHRLTGGGGGVSQAGEEQLWTCPMHPSVIRPEPGSCPICGMDLVLLQQSELSEKSTVEGHGVVEISPQKQQLIGVVTAPVERRELKTHVRTVGLVVVDERLLADVHTKIDGWVEDLYADETGKIVLKGQPLLTIYSPDLVSTQEEYLLALRSQERVKDSPFQEVRRSGESMVAAARRRLELWDVSNRDIERLEQTGEVKKTLTLYAPNTGYIMEKGVVQGMRVTPATTLFRLVDLSRVWVEADVYEYETPMVSEGMAATLTVAAQPDKEFHGRVTYIYPTVEHITRTLTARLEFENPKLILKPGMYGNVTIEASAGEALAIPEQAVLDSGTRKVVFVKRGEGTFLPREVTLGVRAVGYYAVLSGLEEGEVVVSSPNFLIDSESRFQAAMEAMKATSDEQETHAH